MLEEAPLLTDEDVPGVLLNRTKTSVRKPLIVTFLLIIQEQ